MDSCFCIFTWHSLISKLRDNSDNVQLIFLCIAVISMFAAESKSLFEFSSMLIRMVIPMVLFFIVNFVLIRWIGKKLGFNDYNLVPLNFTTLARNSPLSLAIAVAAFPDRPLISLALVIGSLIEIPSLAVIVGIINKLEKVDRC
ncbi:arsenic resistance protein [Veillonella caviae]|uniref:arsenic resistance protein n=1 Tax=Veillonella caviae TaxID=248316 RepID=UPI0023F79BA5|nr:hypothetical protein [Veillonella caviae]